MIIGNYVIVRRGARMRGNYAVYVRHGYSCVRNRRGSCQRHSNLKVRRRMAKEFEGKDESFVSEWLSRQGFKPTVVDAFICKNI